MLGSAARSNPIRSSVSRQTGTARSFVYVPASGDMRRMYVMWWDAGSSSRSGPRMRSAQRSRSAANESVWRRAAS